MEKNQFIIAAIALALIIAVLAPFLASGDPDGLESAFFGMYGAKEPMGTELDESLAETAEEEVIERTGNDFEFASPMPDYAVSGLGKPGEVFAVVVGVLVMIGLVWGIGKAVAQNKE
jgi:cobalt/nickel transport protein